MRGVAKLVVLGAFLAVLGAASAWAATIHGTARANTLHGTPRADTIYGLGGNDTLYGLGGSDKLYGGAGNDKLYGGAGNDLLVGGPGVNVLNCGPGRDKAIASFHDRTIGCESVHRLPAPPVPPVKTTTAPTTTTTPVQPPPPEPVPGRYCGYTNNGGSICFDITSGPVTFTNAQYQTSFDRNDCSPPAAGSVNYTTSGAVPVAADGSFDFAINQGDEAGTDINGTVDTQGNAAGNLHVQSVIASGGTTYTCTLNATWTATRQG